MSICGRKWDVMERILVVDDEDKIRAIIRKYGEFEGYEIAEAHDGMEAVEICRKEDFDLIILDVMMPELDGFSTCLEIRKFKEIPVIMLSARGEEYDKIHGFELGIDDYVVKPFSPRELMMRVKVVISRNNKKEDNLEFTFSIALDFKPKNKELFIDEIKRYCTIENLNYDIISDEYNDMKCLIKIENIMYECILLYSGIASNYIISFNKI